MNGCLRVYIYSSALCECRIICLKYRAFLAPERLLDAHFLPFSRFFFSICSALRRAFLAFLVLPLALIFFNFALLSWRDHYIVVALEEYLFLGVLWQSLEVMRPWRSGVFLLRQPVDEDGEGAARPADNGGGDGEGAQADATGSAASPAIEMDEMGEGLLRPSSETGLMAAQPEEEEEEEERLQQRRRRTEASD